MRNILLLNCFILFICEASAQKKQEISISLGQLTNNIKKDLRPDAEKAFKLMSELYSSQEFQDSLRLLSFPDNSCDNCGSSSIKTGTEIMEVLFSKTNETWDLVIKRKNGALGETIPGSKFTTAYYKNIFGDMCNLPFAVGLAVNLSHEYMHHICFCHPDNPKDKVLRKPWNGINKCEKELYDPVSYQTDIAYRVGWIAYDILLRWHKQGKI